MAQHIVIDLHLRNERRRPAFRRYAGPASVRLDSIEAGPPDHYGMASSSTVVRALATTKATPESCSLLAYVLYS